MSGSPRPVPEQDDDKVLPDITLPFELDDVDELSAGVFRSFMRARRLHRHLMVSVYAEYGVSPSQVICLHFPAANDGKSQRDLAEGLHLSTPTVSKMLRVMQRAGYIERRRDEQDRRLARVYISVAGRNLEAELRQVSAALVNKILTPLGQREKRQLERLLDAQGASISLELIALQESASE